MLLITPSGTGPPAAVQAAAFRIVGPPSLARQADRLAEISPGLAEDLARKLDAPPLPEMTLYLVSERGPDAGPPGGPEGLIPPWAAGVALPERDSILIHADRVGVYPQRSLPGVLAHEIAHLLMHRAAGEGADRMPRWFREGVAGALARDGEAMDFFYLWTSPIVGSSRPLDSMSDAFARPSNPSALKAAYAGSFAFVTFATQRHGERLPARVLEGLRSGLDFETSWGRAASHPLALDEQDWSVSVRGNRRWVAILTSSFAVWTLISVLFVLAAYAKRRRSRRVLERWEQEEPFG